jgi:gluconate kinase
MARREMTFWYVDKERDEQIERIHMAITALQTEVEKCVVFCSNCHRKFHRDFA